jgi:hypothetical protein
MGGDGYSIRYDGEFWAFYKNASLIENVQRNSNQLSVREEAWKYLQLINEVDAGITIYKENDEVHFKDTSD